MAFGGKQFNCKMSCEHELANEWAHCSGKNASYVRNNTDDVCDAAASNNYIVFLRVTLASIVT